MDANPGTRKPGRRHRAARPRRRHVLALLARFGWPRHPQRWTVRCRDGMARRARLRISLSPHGITITASAPGPWTLLPVEVGRLRAALRDSLALFGVPPIDHGDPEPPVIPGPTRLPRRRIDLHEPITPAELSGRPALAG